MVSTCLYDWSYHHLNYHINHVMVIICMVNFLYEHDGDISESPHVVVS